jgi:hypothetical protein
MSPRNVRLEGLSFAQEALRLAWFRDSRNRARFERRAPLSLHWVAFEACPSEGSFQLVPPCRSC